MRRSVALSLTQLLLILLQGECFHLYQDQEIDLLDPELPEIRKLLLTRVMISLLVYILSFQKVGSRHLMILGLNNTKKRILKEITFHIMERSVYIFDEIHEQCYLYILDTIETNLYKEPVKKEKHIRKNVCTIRFVNKGIDEIKVSQIFNLPEVIATLPQELQDKDDISSVAMKLDPPIRNKILNYRQTVSSLHVDTDDEVAILSE